LGIVVAVAIIEGASAALTGTVVTVDADTIAVLEISTAETVEAEETGLIVEGTCTTGDTNVEAVGAEIGAAVEAGTWGEAAEAAAAATAAAVAAVVVPGFPRRPAALVGASRFTPVVEYIESGEE
jgi:hypothetical protein